MEYQEIQTVKKRVKKVFVRAVPLGSKVRLEDYPNEVFTYTGKHYGWFILRSDRKELLVGHYRYVIPDEKGAMGQA